MKSRIANLIVAAYGVMCCHMFGGCASKNSDVANGLSDADVNAALLAYKDVSDDFGQVVVVNAANGHRLNAAAFGAAEDAEWFEAGSVIKPLVVALAFDKGIADGETLYETSMDKTQYPALPSDGAHHWEAKMSVADALVRSSNIVIAKLGVDIGRDVLVNGLTDFGITVDSNAPATRIAVGQGFRVSAEQIAIAYSILFNHGVDGRTGKRIVSAKAADAVCEILKDVVTPKGTARRAAVDGVYVAGKTGTAQRYLNGAYVAGRYNAIFAGASEANGSRYVIVVRYACGGCKNHQGGQRPAEAFADVVRKMVKPK